MRTFLTTREIETLLAFSIGLKYSFFFLIVAVSNSFESGTTSILSAVLWTLIPATDFGLDDGKIIIFTIKFHLGGLFFRSTFSDLRHEANIVLIRNFQYYIHLRHEWPKTGRFTPTKLGNKSVVASNQRNPTIKLIYRKNVLQPHRR